MVHSDLGEHCIGAKVNHKMMPISYVLQSGDQVEVLTAETQKPQREWLGIVTTAKAQTAIKRYLRDLETPEGGGQNIVAYPATFEMHGIDKVGIIVKILNVISDQLNLNIRDMHVVAVEDDQFNCKLQVLVYDELQCESICGTLRKIPEITDVTCLTPTPKKTEEEKTEKKAGWRKILRI
jgi:(p)ppGpp synthase/HD superfamily hydrolase